MAIGRPIQFNPDDVVGAATRAFWARGYEATSLQDLLEATCLSKSSLYQAFGGKQALFRRCVERYTDQSAGRMREQLAAAPSGRKFIETFLSSVLNEVTGEQPPRGCLVMNTASEFSQSEADIAEDVARSVERFRTVLTAAVERAQREGDIEPDRDARTLANFLVSSMSGLKTQAKAGADAYTLKGIISVILKAL